MDKRDNNSAHVAAGSYSGTNSVDRDIPHGLGTLPKFVFILPNSAGNIYTTTETNPDRLTYLYHSASGYSAVSNMDSVNFHVGNDPSNGYGANSTGITYNWVAMA